MRIYKLEEEFDISGEKFKCVEDINAKRCTRCALSSAKYDEACDNFACTREDRKDGKLVIAIKK